MTKRKSGRKRCCKVSYPNKAAARKAFKEFGKARGAKRFYRCPHHDVETWHLTSEGKRK